MSKEDLHVQLEQLTASLKQADEVRAELDRRIFHLKTLYDVSKDLYGSVEVDAILRSFLLMSMGNFGVVTGRSVFRITTPLRSEISVRIS